MNKLEVLRELFANSEKLACVTSVHAYLLPRLARVEWQIYYRLQSAVHELIAERRQIQERLWKL